MRESYYLTQKHIIQLWTAWSILQTLDLIYLMQSNKLVNSWPLPSLHLAVVKRIVHYVHGTLQRGLCYHVGTSPTLHAYRDVDYARCSNTWRSTIGWCLFFGPTLISWKSKNKIVFLSHLLNLSTRLCPKLIYKYFGYMDSLLSLAFDMIHLLLFMVTILVPYILLSSLFAMRLTATSFLMPFEDKIISLSHVTSTLHVANIFTKTLIRQRHHFLVDKLMLIEKSTSIWGECQ